MGRAGGGPATTEKAEESEGTTVQKKEKHIMAMKIGRKSLVIFLCLERQLLRSTQTRRTKLAEDL